MFTVKDTKASYLGTSNVVEHSSIVFVAFGNFLKENNSPKIVKQRQCVVDDQKNHQSSF